MSLSTFIQLSTRMLVRDIYSEVRLEYDASDRFHDAQVEAHEADDDWYQTYSVKSGSLVVGWGIWDDSCLPGEADDDSTMSDRMLPIRPDEIVSCETSP